MWTAPVFGSNVPFSIGIGAVTFSPPVTLPVNAFPSNFSESVTGLRSPGLGPQSPDQVPLTASCANADATMTRHARKHANAMTLIRTQPPFEFELRTTPTFDSLAKPS